MKYFDCHCDYLWAKETGKPTSYKTTKDGKVVLAVFEGKEADRNLVLRQIKDFCTTNNTRIGFEGLGWVNGLKDVEFIMNNAPLYVAPMWNNKNQFGGSCYDDGVVTKFGQCFLSEFDKCNVYIDLAHSGEYMFYSCVDVFKNVIFSHGNVYDVFNHPRNLKKQQIKKLIDKNSFFGLSLYSGFLGENREDNKNAEENFIKNIDYVLSLGGENILGLGSDIDGCESIVFSQNSNLFDRLFDKLLQQNYEENLINKIFFGNLERIENENLKYFPKIKKIQK